MPFNRQHITPEAYQQLIDRSTVDQRFPLQRDLGAAASAGDHLELEARFAPVDGKLGPGDGVRELTVGVSWYFRDHRFEVQADTSRLESRDATIECRAHAARTLHLTRSSSRAPFAGSPPLPSTRESAMLGRLLPRDQHTLDRAVRAVLGLAPVLFDG